MNDLIPMLTPKGEPAYVSTWDVEKRKANGWTVAGEIDEWTGRETAPDFTKPPAPPAKAPKAPVAPPAS